MKTIIISICAIALSLPAFAAKRVIVISRQTSGASVCYQTANWFVITSGAQSGSNGSVWTGASAAENTAIQNGTVLEEVVSQCFPVGQDVTSIKAVLVQQWTNRQAQINGVGPAQFQGVFFDSSTGWSQ